jgi:AraC family transcriptional regulator
LGTIPDAEVRILPPQPVNPKSARTAIGSAGRAFKQSFGVPPHRYLTDRRIERAKDLLAERKLSVTKIALDVGSARRAPSPPPFASAPGETPTDYRRSLA